MQIMKNHIESDYKLPDLKAKNVEGKRFYEKKTELDTHQSLRYYLLEIMKDYWRGENE